MSEATGPGLYVHWPFCLSKCAYCDFNSVALAETGGESFLRRYAEALKREWAQRAEGEEFKGARFQTVYFGGGTPTIVPTAVLLSAARAFGLSDKGGEERETSLEANPESADEGKLAALRQVGFNRLSLGVQSFSDETLRFLGRRHSAAEARAAIAAARRAGFENLSLDLIYGVPGEAPAGWQATLKEALAIGPQHISAYCLAVEEGTELARRLARGEFAPTPPDLQAEMLWLGREMLTGAGYEHYEISNYARPGFACRHNRNYWRRGEYLGLGAGAHSFRNGVRWWNLSSPLAYVAALEEGRLPVAGAERLSLREAGREFLFLGLRQSEGVRRAHLDTRFGTGAALLLGQAAGLCEEGLLVAEEGRLRLAPRALAVSNQVFARLLS